MNTQTKMKERIQNINQDFHPPSVISDEQPSSVLLSKTEGAYLPIGTFIEKEISKEHWLLVMNTFFASILIPFNLVAGAVLFSSHSIFSTSIIGILVILLSLSMATLLAFKFRSDIKSMKKRKKALLAYLDEKATPKQKDYVETRFHYVRLENEKTERKKKSLFKSVKDINKDILQVFKNLKERERNL